MSENISVRAALMQTTNTMGWAYIRKMTVEIRARAIQEALDEENPVIGESKRLKAKALQSGFNDLFAAIEEIISAVAVQGDPEPFGNLNEFEETANGR